MTLKAILYRIYFLIALLFFISCENNEQNIREENQEPAKISNLEIEGYVDSLKLDFAQKTPIITFKDTIKTKLLQSKINSIILDYYKLFESSEDTLFGTNNLFNVYFDVYQNSATFLSVRLGLDVYFIGSAHGMEYFETINYDIKNNQFLELSDILLNLQSGLEEISKISEKQSKEKLPYEPFLEGISAELENYKRFNLTDSSIIFTFLPYQIASYSEGSQEIEILMKNIKNIKKDFVK